MIPDDYNSLAYLAVLIKDFLLKHSAPLVKPTRKNKKCGKVFIKLPEDVKRHDLSAIFLLIPGNFLTAQAQGDIHETYRASRKGRNCPLFSSTNVKLMKLLSSVILQSQMKNYFGNLSKVSALHLRWAPLLWMANCWLSKARFVICGLIIWRHLAPIWNWDFWQRLLH